MKFTAILLLSACLQVSANGFSQQVTMKKNDASLRDVISVFKKQTGYFFVYDLQLIRMQPRLDVNFRNTPLTEALNSCFNALPLEYEITEKTVIIRLRRLLINPASSNISNNITVKGKVTDDNGKPVEGATITLKGSKKATATNAQGLFTLPDIPADATLIISSIGFEQREVKINGRADIGSISIHASADKIEEVVVTTGLFKRPVENFTGVATSVSGEQIRNVNAMSVFDALKVFDPAMRVPDNLQFGSDPNRLPQLSLRGTNNFPLQGDPGLPASGADFMAAWQSNPSMPLFILDGFEVSLQKIYDLDINRIARMTILKDAVATSAYGSRAANGVIVVETKQPQSGKLMVSYSNNIQITGPDLTSYKLLDARGKLEVEQLSGMYNGGARPDFQYYYDELYAQRRAAVERGTNTYWLSQPLQTGLGQKHSLYVEGGDQHIRYGVNFGYTRNKGVMKGSNRDTYEGGMNLSYRNKNILVRNQLTITGNRASNSPWGDFATYTRLNPYWSPYDVEGNVQKVLEVLRTPGYAGSTIVANPMYDATLGTLNRSRYMGFNNNTFLEYRFGKGFRLTGKLGLTSQEDQGDIFLPADHSSFATITDFNSTEYLQRGSYTRNNSSFFNYDASLLLDYNKYLGKSLLFATFGASAAQQNSRATAVTVRGFPNNRLDEIYFGKEYLANSRPTGQNNVSRRMSLFTSLNYTYDRRYLLDVSLNMDGSSQFGSENRMAAFWATGAGWNIHEEAFMHQLVKSRLVNRLKLRAGIGTTGSQQFPPYMAKSTYAYNTTQEYLGMFGANLITYGNTSLKWQQTLKQNIGADITLWNERIVLRLDAYREITNDLLLDINTPPSLGVSAYKENIGKLLNTGVEGAITAFLIKKDKQSIFWNIMVNAIHNKNRIREISNSLRKMNEKNDATTSNLQTRPQPRYEEGQSVNALWAVRSAGIDPGNGQEVYITRNGELTYNWNAADKVIVGDALPTISGNLGTQFSYKGLQLSVYCSYQLGGKLYNQTLADRIENADIRYNVDERVLLGRWKNPGDVTYFKGLADLNGMRVTSTTNATSRFVQTNNYLDMESISLSYILSDKITGRWGLHNTRVGFQVNNLARISSIQVERGLSYPFARNFTFNLNTSF
ncbi:MAG: SusC/RagA family TonB-linked outer membrane protein [Pseudobacter sp.]|uniref:SusC/RagA family TonB-linked outer membrane protein n=1 Tax=Pseudobacter sp. TaxID=2045420 RepID=UPI003F7D779F